MSDYAWIVCGLAAFDVFLVAVLFLFLRSQSINRQGRLATAIGLSGFVFHAFLFFDGAILYVQLATLAIIYMALALWPLPGPSTEGPSDRP